jgi:hypothetical protein
VILIVIRMFSLLAARPRPTVRPSSPGADKANGHVFS